jgi:putative DNA-invertase from lambdoid prophage Rac
VKAALYARVSTSDQNCAAQLQELGSYCLTRTWDVYDRYVDPAMSGAKDRRPELDRLMKDAKSRRFDAIVVTKLDRFSRSLSHMVSQLAELQAAGVRFLAINQGIDTGIDNPAGRLMANLLGSFAEFERDLIRERTCAGIAYARLMGKQFGRPRVIVDKVAVQAMRAAGQSWAVIAHNLKISRSTVRRACARSVPVEASTGTVETLTPAGVSV